MDNIVEIDETYVGGKFENMNRKKLHEHRDSGKDNKTAVMGLLERDGKAKLTVIGKNTFKEVIRQNVAPSAIVITDSHLSYSGLQNEFAAHETVNHNAGEYKRDNWHTNTIEGFWSQLKRTLKGTHIHCDPKYLQLYADEVAFRYMNRERQSEMFYIILSHVV